MPTTKCRTLRVIAVMLAYSIPGACQEEIGAPDLVGNASLFTEHPEIERFIRDNNEVIAGMPSHPASGELLGNGVHLYEGLFGLGHDEALLKLAADFPDLNVGLYALSVWCEGQSDQTEKQNALWSILRGKPDTRLARFSLAEILEMAADDRAICETVLNAHAGTAAADFASEKLAELCLTEEKYLDALLLYLGTLSKTLETAPERADRIRGRLATAFRSASLPLCSAAADALAHLEPSVQLAELSRLKAFVERLEGTGSAASPGVQEQYGSLWKNRDDHEALFHLGRNSSDSRCAVYARFMYAAAMLHTGRTTEFLDSVEELTDKFGNASLLLDGSFHIFLDAFHFVHGAAATYPASDIRAVLTAERELLDLLRLFVDTANPALQSRDEMNLALVRAACAFRAAGRLGDEFNAIRRMCMESEDAAERARLHLKAARLCAERWGRYDLAIEQCVLAQRLSTDRSAMLQARLLEAQCLYIAEEFTAALQRLEAISAGPADPHILQNVAHLKSLTLGRLGRYKEAIEELDGMRRSAGEGPVDERVLFLKIYWSCLGGITDIAHEGLQEFLVRYPTSSLSDEAKKLKASIGQPVETDPLDPEKHPSAASLPNVVLISLDTTRADHLACYGYSRETTPNIDRLAQAGVLFERAYSTSAWTKPAHASLFTSLFPSVHGAVTGVAAIQVAPHVLAEWLRMAGYATLGVASAGPLHAEFGFDRGFDFYDDVTFDLDRIENLFRRKVFSSSTPTEDKEDLNGYSESLVTDSALALLMHWRETDQPFFLFVNYFGAHNNYTPPWPQSDRFDPEYAGSLDGKVDRWHRNPVALRERMLPGDYEHLLTLYDGEIAAVDAQVGRLVDEIPRLAQGDNTIYILFGDHGEEFLEHGQLHHARSLYQEVVHIPLIVFGPGIPEGVRVANPVSLLDVFPSLASFLGLEDPKGMQGQDLCFGDPEAYDGVAERPILIEVETHPDAQFKAVVVDNWKLVRDSVSGDVELYNLDQDSEESDNLAQVYPRVSESLGSVLDGLIKQNEGVRSGLSVSDNGEPAVEETELSAELREQLKALGYLRN